MGVRLRAVTLWKPGLRECLFRMEVKSEKVGHPVNGEVGGSLAIQVRSVFALEFS